MSLFHLHLIRSMFLSVGFLVVGCCFHMGCGTPADVPKEPSIEDAGNVDGRVSTEPVRPDETTRPEPVNPDIGRSLEPVSTASGPVKGMLDKDVIAFLGIPYAAPPIGELRWKAPIPPKSWTQPLEATAFSQICPQQSTGLPGQSLGTESEDCLYLNVWTPHPAPKKAPVMVWIHGGAFVSNTASNPTFNGANISRSSGVVVVSMNYRLGVPGFLSHPALGVGSGNYGLMDQVAALKWVKANIEAFGGDPGNVTLFGLSAGGVSTCIHLVSKESKGLFHRAVIQSGPCNLVSPLERAEKQGEALAKKLGCEGEPAQVVTCLRSKSVNELNQALPPNEELLTGSGTSWVPVTGTALLPQNPMALMQSGSINKVPVMLGSSQNEGTLFVFAAGQTNMTDEQYQDVIKASYTSKASEVLALYPRSAYQTPAAAYADVLGDVMFICPTRRAARSLSAAGLTTYLYHFTRTSSFVPVPFLGAFHGAELPYVFGNPPNSGFSTEEATLSKALQGYWTRFASEGAPAVTGATNWPTYDAATDTHLELNLNIESGTGLKKAKCDFWDSL